MRVLDLGCSDAYLAPWLAQKLDGALHYDGIELREDAVEAANARLTEAGIDGKVYAGSVEEAVSLLWDEHDCLQRRYDAVLCMEVIEHVVDVEALLQEAERLCAPDGRIYLSTPDGTFGAGGNPLHLRTFTGSQLADLARRRGRLHDFETGADGIATVSYTPMARKGRVVIHTGSGWEPWGFQDIVEKGLGGSETAAARLAHHLSEQGYIVDVYGRVKEGMVREVRYLDERKWRPKEWADLMISSRLPELADADPNCGVFALWMHDTDCGPRLTPERAAKFDHIFVLSDWHQHHVADLYPFAKSKLTRIRNGIHPPYYDAGMEWAERDPLLVYTSSPDRGLDVMLDLWPEIRARCLERDVDPTFAFCYASVYEAVAAQAPDVAGFRAGITRQIEALNEAAGEDGAHLDRLGSLSQPDLAKLMGYARVWANPAWHTLGKQPFMETFCIGAVEAQASGCYVVAANRGALREVVKTGALVGGFMDGPADEDWSEEFIDQIVTGLCEDTGAQREAPGPVSALDWAGVADRVAALIPAPNGANLPVGIHVAGGFIRSGAAVEPILVPGDALVVPVGEMIPSRLGSTDPAEDAILAAIQDAGGQGAQAALAKAAGLTPGKAKGAFARLERSLTLKKTGESVRNSPVWALNEQGGS